MGCVVLPHLKSLVEIIEHGLNGENQKVRTIIALSLASLVEATTPYGIEVLILFLNLYGRVSIHKLELFHN